MHGRCFDIVVVFADCHPERSEGPAFAGIIDNPKLRGNPNKLVLMRKRTRSVRLLRLFSAARARRDRGAVGASARVVEEDADLVGSFGRQDVFKLAGLLFDFGFAVHGERVGEEALGQAVTTDDVGGALQAARREFDDQCAVADRYAGGFEGIVTGIHESLVIVRLGRMGAQGHEIHGL